MGVAVRLLSQGALAAAAVCSLFASPAAGQFGNDPRAMSLAGTISVDEADSTLRNHLERVAALVKDKQWEEAVETLRRVQESYGDKLIRISPPDEKGSVRYISVREYVQIQLCRFHDQAPEALVLYRKRVDGLSERWYREGLAARDAERLARVAQQFFASSFGDKATNALAELYLEAGRFTAARAAWEQLSPELRWSEKPPTELGGRPGMSLWQALRGVDLAQHWAAVRPALALKSLPATALVYPDTRLNLAEIRARLVLVSILEGVPERAALELEVFKRLEPAATGKLAGRQGKYVDLLSELLTESRSWPAERPPGSWPTFAGALDRNGLAPALDSLALRPRWNVSLGPALKGDGDALALGHPRVAEDLKELLSYHPVITQGLVFLAQPSGGQARVKAFDLRTGAAAWPRAAGTGEPGEIYPAGLKANVPAIAPSRGVGVPRYTLTVQGHKLFVRLDAATTIEPGEVIPARTQDFILGLDLAAQGRLLPGFPIRPDDPKWSFAGTPVCNGENLFVAMRLAGAQPQLHVAAYDVQTGSLRWRRFVAAADTAAKGILPEVANTLLTLDEETIYVSTNLGAVAALAASDGAVRWLSTYPRAAQPPESGKSHWFRDLTPCLVHQGVVVALPSDADGLFAFDAASGRFLWECGPVDKYSDIDAVHLLGARDGYVFASGRYLWWLSLQSGQVAARFPQQGLSGPGLAAPNPQGFGRGLLAGSEVYWPTRVSLYTFRVRPAEGQPVMARDPVNLLERNVKGGNLVSAGGYLLIAGADTLYCLGGPPAANLAAENGEKPAPAVQKNPGP